MEPTKPLLVTLFEELAEVLALDEGSAELRVQFDDGRLRRWWATVGPNGHEPLRRFDGRAAHLLERVARAG